MGAPLVGWVGRTLEQLWSVQLPPDNADTGVLETSDVRGAENDEAVVETYAGMVGMLFEYVDLCVDWTRVEVREDEQGEKSEDGTEKQRNAVRDAVALLIAAAIRSGESKEVKSKVDEERSGIAMWRIP